MKRTAQLIAAACLGGWLCACSPPEAEPEPDADAAVQVGEAQTLQRTLPPPGETPRYVGVWATSSEGCVEPAWRFEERGVSTRGEVSCEFSEVTLTPTGYNIAATCHAQAPPELHTIQLSFAESARAMMLSGGPWSAPTSLVYCGPLTNP